MCKFIVLIYTVCVAVRGNPILNSAKHPKNFIILVQRFLPLLYVDVSTDNLHLNYR